MSSENERSRPRLEVTNGLIEYFTSNPDQRHLQGEQVMDAQGLSALGRLIWRNRIYDNWTQYNITKERITGQREKPTMVNKNGEDRAERGGNDKTGIFSKAAQSISRMFLRCVKAAEMRATARGVNNVNAVARDEKVKRPGESRAGRARRGSKRLTPGWHHNMGQYRQTHQRSSSDNKPSNVPRPPKRRKAHRLLCTQDAAINPNTEQVDSSNYNALDNGLVLELYQAVQRRRSPGSKDFGWLRPGAGKGGEHSHAPDGDANDAAGVVGAKKEKARKKAKAQKLLDEQQQRVEETARPAPSPFDTSPPTLADTPVPSISAARVVPTPTSAPRTPALLPAVPREARTPPPLPLPRFPIRFLPYQVDAEPPPLPPSQWPEHVRAFVYGNWADDIPEPVTPGVVMAITHAPRWSSLRSVGGHPWRAIRRRKRRLRPEGSWERHAHFDMLPSVPLHIPSPPLPVSSGALQQGLSLRPADLLGLIPLHPDDPFHPDVIPANNLPPPTLCLFPDDHPPSEFPVDTEFGEVNHELAYTCSRALPVSHMGPLLRDFAWPPLEYPDGSVAANPDARPELLALLPPDQVVFLCAIVVMGRIEPAFTLFFDSVVADFVHGWVQHCELVGDMG
ncbi:hypothetical protein DFH09DRAFT_1276823 [Mycena vulgaris]|nr:hypothetical protein DFH09DRAFT_1276823 [Mycena vulgaris]